MADFGEANQVKLFITVFLLGYVLRAIEKQYWESLNYLLTFSIFLNILGM